MVTVRMMSMSRFVGWKGDMAYTLFKSGIEAARPPAARRRPLAKGEVGVSWRLKLRDRPRRGWCWPASSLESSSSESVDSLAVNSVARWSLMDLREVGETEAVREGGYEYAGGGVASEAEGEWSRLIWREAKGGTAADGPAFGVEGEMVGGSVLWG